MLDNITINGVHFELGNMVGHDTGHRCYWCNDTIHNRQEILSDDAGNKFCCADCMENYYHINDWELSEDDIELGVIECI